MKILKSAEIKPSWCFTTWQNHNFALNALFFYFFRWTPNVSNAQKQQWKLVRRNPLRSETFFIVIKGKTKNGIHYSWNIFPCCSYLYFLLWSCNATTKLMHELSFRLDVVNSKKLWVHFRKTVQIQHWTAWWCSPGVGENTHWNLWGALFQTMRCLS